MKTSAQFFRLARFENCILPVLALGAGYFTSRADYVSHLLISAFSLIAIHTVVTIWNDIADEEGDRNNQIERIANIREEGNLSHLRAVLIFISVMVIFASFFVSGVAVVMMASLLLLGWIYNHAPVRASCRPIASLVVLGISYAALPFLLGASLGHIGHAVILMSVGWTVGRVSLSMLKDYKDAPGDAVSNKRTFLLVYGGTLTARLSSSFAFIGFAVCGLIAVGLTHSLRYGIALVAAALGLLAIRSQLFRERNYVALNRVFHESLKYQVLFDGLVILCLRTL